MTLQDQALQTKEAIAKNDLRAAIEIFVLFARVQMPQKYMSVGTKGNGCLTARTKTPQYV